MDGSICKTLDINHAQDLKHFREIGRTHKNVGKFHVNASN